MKARRRNLSSHTWARLMHGTMLSAATVVVLAGCGSSGSTSDNKQTSAPAATTTTKIGPTILSAGDTDTIPTTVNPAQARRDVMRTVHAIERLCQQTGHATVADKIAAAQGEGTIRLMSKVHQPGLQLGLDRLRALPHCRYAVDAVHAAR
jgi:hypothetical protein